ncbi:UvrD-helicase domain-containing protein [Tomitella biformata]|uniref:UvrD-helicase domain-containing protein n=1 Tax=Tomitella biformata TaxID=630403 RepID=UPI000466A4D5|nr:UvrD-helicase domain-containing protein [Tomitella biformata]
MSAVGEILVDAVARRVIEEKTDATLFVEAGAGSGKTHALVSRICTLALRDGVELDRVAAITFTEKAAAELRERVRGRLAELEPEDDRESSRRDLALSQIDTAAIGTLHAFAARIVGEHPLEAGVPPRISVVDAMGSDLAFERRWQAMRGALFPRVDAGTGTPGTTDVGAVDVGAAMTVLLDAGASLDQVREVARELDKHWDRLPEPSALAALQRPDPLPLLMRVDLLLDNLASCGDLEDKFAATLGKVRDWRDKLAAADDRDWMAIAHGCPTRGVGGAAKNWAGGKDQVMALKDEVTDIGAAAAELCDQYVGRALQIVVGAISTVVLEQAAHRRRSGALEFHDLLVYARKVLDVPGVQEQLYQRYQRILLDEFQDTDPLQLEIAAIITAGEPGRLFTVGDPKQSIYRFRRADIATYMAARDSQDENAIITLQTNFRSSRPVLAWANAVFGKLITAQDRTQPEYVPLAPAPGRPEWLAEWGPTPFVFANPPAEYGESLEGLSPADAVRAAEAADVARVIGTAIQEGWRKEVGGHGKFSHEPLRLKDMCLLLPTRTALPYLEAALDAAGIEYRAEASSLVYSTQEIHDLLLTARALAYSADRAALVGALRTAMFACGDDDLLRWQSAGGQWRVSADIPAGLANSPVARAFGYLNTMAGQLPELSPAAVLSRLVTDRRVFEVSMDTPRYRDSWRRLRFVIDQAQAWYEAGGGDLRDYLDWAQTQQAEDARVTEAVLPEDGVDAVRIMTMHASKGLQFPMVVIAGMSGGFRPASRPVLWDGAGVVKINLSKHARTEGYREANAVEDAHTAAERIRLLYVACTRAESFLAVSGHLPTNAGWGKVLADGLDAVPNDPPPLCSGPAQPPEPRAIAGAPTSLSQWRAESARVAALSAQRSTLSATEIGHSGPEAHPDTAPGIGATVRQAYMDGGLVPAAGGTEKVAAAIGATESGAEYGTALHAFLESADLTAPSDGAGAHAAAIAAEVADPERFVALVRSALESEPVQAAAAREHWKEMQLAGIARGAAGARGAGDSTDTADVLVVEGIADLIYRADDGSLVIVDYKTDVGVSAATLEAYWTQLAVYADLLDQTARENVSALVLVFLREGRAQVLERRW